MEFEFRRIDGEDFESERIKFAPNKIVGAVLSTIENANTYAIYCGGERVGALCESGGFVDCFFIAAESYLCAEPAFLRAIKELGLVGARAYTADSKFLSLCLFKPHTVVADKLCYTFSAEREMAYLPIRCAKESDLPKLSVLGFVPEHKLERLIKRHSVYVCESAERVTGFGVVEETAFGAALISAFTDVGYRNVGIGSYIFHRLGGLCRDCLLQPVALCGINDFACKKALEKAGFACAEKRVVFLF